MVASISGLDLSYVGPLSGGVSGSTVWRARWAGRDVVAKRTSASELAALRLFADLDEPMLPELLASGVDESGPWVVIPAAYDSPARRAHDQGWADVAGTLPDRTEDELAHAWSVALINAMYAGVVAVRASVSDAETMIGTGEAAAARFSRLHGQLRG